MRVTPTDYEAWHKVHMAVITEHGAEAGMISEVLYRDHEDSRTVVIVTQIEDIDRFAAFIASPYIQETIAKAPIEGPPTFWFVRAAQVIADIPALATS